MLLYRVVGANLRAARMRIDVTQVFVAEHSGITSQYYGQIERGEAKFKLHHLEAICGALTISMSDALDGATVDTTEEGY